MELIERELYMEKVRPFINNRGAVKVFTGIRRCGKSVMMELVQRELCKNGVRAEQIVSLNFKSRSLPAVISVESAYACV